jgi:hypothetical protein
MNKIKNFIDFINEGFINKFNIRPIQTETFSGRRVVYFEYTTNGILYKKIKTCSNTYGYDPFKKYGMYPLAYYDIHYNKDDKNMFKAELEKFSSLEKIKKYEEEQQKECEEKNASLIRQQKEL